jgi:hypothetical protein
MTVAECAHARTDTVERMDGETLCAADTGPAMYSQVPEGKHEHTNARSEG